MLPLIFSFLHQDWSSDGFRDRIAPNLDLWNDTGCLPVWTLSNHEMKSDIGLVTPLLGDGSPDGEVANIRYQISPCSNYGIAQENIPLQRRRTSPPQADVPDEDRQDPAFFRQTPDSDYKGRDGARVPMPWDANLPNAGFTNSEPWLPMSEEWHDYSVSIQHDNPNSMLNYYRSMIQLRRIEDWMKSDSIDEVESSSDILSFVKKTENKRVRVLMNFSDSDFRFDNNNTIMRTSDSDISDSFFETGGTCIY